MKQKGFVPILLVIIIFIAIAGVVGLAMSKNLLNKDASIIISSQDLKSSEKGYSKQLSISKLDNKWLLIKNEKYGYEVKVPPSDDGDRQTESLSFIYRTSQNLNEPYLGSIAINLIGIIDEDPETFIRNLFTQTLEITSETNNEITAFRTKARRDGSGNDYYSYFVQNSDNLLFEIRFDSNDLTRDLTAYNEVVKSFRFVYEIEQLPPSLTLTGRVTKTTGNCMPVIGASSSCKTTPLSTEVAVFPMLNISRNFQRSELNDSKIIQKTSSDASGRYSIELPPGSYSIFINDGEKTCAGSDGYGFACKVTLYKTDEKMDLNVSEAVY
jgi:hypothetical protein